jgi:hypothetical protein
VGCVGKCYNNTEGEWRGRVSVTIIQRGGGGALGGGAASAWTSGAQTAAVHGSRWMEGGAVAAGISEGLESGDT